MTITVSGTDITFNDSSVQTVAGIPAMEFIITVNYSGETEADFTAFDATKYDSYTWHFGNVIPSSDGARLDMLTSTTGGGPYDVGASDYGWAINVVGFDAAGAAGNQTDGDATDASMEMTDAIGSAGGEDGLSGFVTMYHPHLTKRTQVTWQFIYEESGGDVESCVGGGHRLATEDVDAIQFKFTSGNLESGTITMYGIRNSA